MLVPSARYDGRNLVLFTERIDDSVTISVVRTEAVDWTSWRKAGTGVRGGTDA